MSSPTGGDDDGPRKPDGPPTGPHDDSPDATPSSPGDGTEASTDEPEGAEIIAWPGRRREPAADEPPANDAEDLVVKALSSITGRDPADLLKELRAREAAERSESEGGHGQDRAHAAGQVIDLGAVRAARERAQHGAGADLGGVAREAFRAVMDVLAKLQPEGGELVIDRNFVKAHGPTLLGSVLETVGKALLGRGVEEPGAAARESAAEDMRDEGDDADEVGEDATAERPAEIDGAAADGAAEASARPVEVRFDLGSLAVGLLSRLGMFRGTVGSADAGPPADFDATSLGRGLEDDGQPDDDGSKDPEAT